MTAPTSSYAAIAAELEWLKHHPAFDERPASVREFLGPKYLDIEGRVRPAILAALVDIIGEEVDGFKMTVFPRAMITGGIGIGKTTVASVILPYMAHWVLCLKDPQGFFDLLPGTRIAFMQMSTSESQATEVVFGDVKARIEYSPWFQNNYPFDPKFKNQIRFPKDIWILPGDSAETTFEGYNILGGILDEADSHKVTKTKDYAEQGYTTIHSRIASRFGDRGFLLVIGQMKRGNGFAARKFEELKKDPKSYTVRMAIWESLGWHKFLKDDGTRDSFWYDVDRKEIIPAGVAELLGSAKNIEIPNLYLTDFQNNPEKALRDLAGIPPLTGSPFISLPYKIETARNRWIERYQGLETPVDTRGRLAPWFKATNSLKCVAHLDIAYSPDGDALGLAMGHVEEVVVIDGERKPYIVIDLLMRIHAPAGREIFLGDIRRIIYDLRDERKFKIVKVTMDGFQCFTGDTKVPLLDGRTLSMAELADQYPDGGVHAYSYDGKKIVPGRVTKAWRTGTKKVIKVRLDNGEDVRCTPDHRWMLRDGSYKQATDLQPGDSLMPLYREVTPDDWKGLQGYERVWQPRDEARGGRKWQFTHRMVWGSDSPKGHVVHHIDVNKLNNDPSNLREMTVEDHNEWHRKNGADFAVLWNDPGFRAKTSAAVSRSNSESTGHRARRFRHDITIEGLAACRHLSRRVVTEQSGWSQDVIYSRVREAGFTGWDDFRKNYSPNNHKVIAVIDDGEFEDVYDLTIEDHHNFALDAGVFVHNSTDTRQQLERRRIGTEIVSVDRVLTPYSDLREAIYEDRIEIPKYMVRLRPDDTTMTEIAYKELSELVDDGLKVDHPEGGSKDVADSMAGVVYTLMGDRTYHRRRMMLDSSGPASQPPLRGQNDRFGVPSIPGLESMHAPLPPAGGIGAWQPPRR